MISSTMNSPQVRRAPQSANLYDILELILDKGIVVDAFVRVSLVGIELLTVDLRVVIASVDTYLRYAEAVERLSSLRNPTGAVSLPDMVGDHVTDRAVSRGVHRVKEAITGNGQEHEEASEGGNGVLGTLAKGAPAAAVGALASRAVSKLAKAVTGDGDEAGAASAPRRAARKPRTRQRSRAHR